MVGWVKVAQRDRGASLTVNRARYGLCSLEVNPATEDPPHLHVGSTHPAGVNHPGKSTIRMKNPASSFHHRNMRRDAISKVVREPCCYRREGPRPFPRRRRSSPPRPPPFPPLLPPPPRRLPVVTFGCFFTSREIACSQVGIPA